MFQTKRNADLEVPQEPGNLPFSELGAVMPSRREPAEILHSFLAASQQHASRMARSGHDWMNAESRGQQDVQAALGTFVRAIGHAEWHGLGNEAV